MSRPATIRTYRDEAGEWRWSQIRNGRIVSDSGESYGTEWKAQRAARAAATSPLVLLHDNGTKEVLR